MASRSRRLMFAGLTVAGLSIAGCQHPTPPPTSEAAFHPIAPQPVGHRPAPNTPVPDHSATASTEPTDSRYDSATLLAARTQSYANTVSPRSTTGASSDSAIASPSVNVNWVDPGELHLGTQTDAKPNPPANAAQPNVQIASVDSVVPPRAVPARHRDDTEPKQVPETQDFPPQANGVGAGVGSDVLGTKLASQARDYPKDMAAQLDNQLFEFLQDQPVPELPALANLPTEDREVLSAVLDSLTNFRNGLRSDPNMLESKKIQPLLDLADRLRAEADLTIPTLTLCKKVEGFGVYDPMPTSFAAGADHWAIMYAEVANFTSTLDENKMWDTHLSEQAVIYTETGLKVWGDTSTPIADQSRNRRHDFFIIKKIKLPANLTIGRYLLKVSIVDQQANRVAESTLPIDLVAQ